MKTGLKWTLRILLGFVGVIALFFGFIYLKSNSVMAQTYTFREVPVLADTDSALLARGEHLTKLGCRGCHGDSLQGRMFSDDPVFAKIRAPGIAAAVHGKTDSELAGFFRHGVRKDGSSPLFMPPSGLWHLSDYDLAAIVEYTRTLTVAQEPAAERSYGPIGRALVAFGAIKPSVAMMDTNSARVGADSAYRTTRRGEYLARVVCASCHGANLLGEKGVSSPALSAALGYSLPELTNLLRTGTPRAAETKLLLMAEVAKSDLKNMTDDEIAAVHEYLSKLPASGVPGAAKQ
jgi:mono/diheme cytochrome c family protein